MIEGVTLNYLNPSDSMSIALLANDWDVAKWTASIPHPYLEQDASNWILQVSYSVDVVARSIRACDQLVGCITCDIPTGEIGLWIGRRWWSHGFATAALDQMLQLLKGKVPAARIWAATLPDNDRSRSALLSAGLVEQGTLVTEDRLRHRGSLLIRYGLHRKAEADDSD